MSSKLKVVEYAEKTSKEAAARHFGVDAKRIQRKQKRLHGAGRKALDTCMDMEEALFSWIVDLRGRNLSVSRKMIRQHARSLLQLEYCDIRV